MHLSTKPVRSSPNPRQAALSASRLFDEPEAYFPKMLRRGEASDERTGWLGLRGRPPVRRF